LWPLQKSGQRIQRVLPGVALVGHVPLEHGQADGFAGLPAVLEAPRQRRDLGEVRLLSQKPAHLELGVDAFLEPAEHLEDETLAEDDRVVALLGHRQRRLETNRLRSPEAQKRPRRRADQHATSAGGPPPPPRPPTPRPPSPRRRLAIAPSTASAKAGGPSASYSSPRPSSPWTRTQAMPE